MDYEPITKGLRERLARLPIIDKTEGKLTDLCDNIDAIHRSLERENKEMFDFCDRLMAASEYRKDVTLYGVDYIPVPLDKDGVPIHIGDTLEWSDGTTFEVIGIGDGGKVNLSIKRLQPRPQRENAPHREPRESRPAPKAAAPVAPPAPKTADQLFEEKLKAFMSESDSKISSCRQYSEHRTKSRRR